MLLSVRTRSNGIAFTVGRIVGIAVVASLEVDTARHRGSRHDAPVAMTGADTTELLELAQDMAREAGDLLLSYRSRPDLTMSTKTSATDPVSEADQAAERLISDRIAAARPADGMLGEEDAGNRTGTSGLRWVVDPLDGTVNYLYGIPQWCVSIAVEDGDGPVVGVVHDPNRGETFSACRGGGSTVNGVRLAVTSPASLATSLIATGFGYQSDVRRDQVRMVAELLPTIRDLRRAGSAALDLCWTAAGRWDGYAEFGLRPWDRSAGGLIVTEAGGTVSLWQLELGGAPREGVVAGGTVVHEALAAWVSRHGSVPIRSDA
jgi:myo-inositol-1(or 4)-monophosphatase